MSPSAAPPVARQGNQSGMETVALATDPSGRYSRQNVLSVAKIPKYLLNPAVTNRCIVATATLKSELSDRASLMIGTYIGRGSLAYVCQKTGDYPQRHHYRYEGLIAMEAKETERRLAKEAERLAKEQERRKARLAREQAIEEAQKVAEAKRAEKRVAEEAEQLAKEQARKKACFAREQAIEEAREARKARETEKR